MASIPHLNEFVETFEGDDFVIMMISMEEAGVLTEFAGEHELDMWLVRDADGDMFQDYGVRGIPNSLLIGKDGKIAYRGHPMRITEEMIQEQLDAE